MAKLPYLISTGLCLAASLSASADLILDRPAGTEKTYELTTRQIYSGETYNFSGVLSTLIFDGDDVWFQDPVTAFGVGAWVKGERQGDKIRVKNGQMIFHQDASEGYPELDVCITSGRWLSDMPWADGEEYTEFTVLGDGTIVLPEGKLLLATDQYGGVLASNDGYYFHPVDPAAVCTPPAGLEPESYCMRYRDSNFGENMYRLVDIMTDGDDFYIKGLCGTYAPDAWSVGHRDGDYIKFESAQYQGIVKNTFLNYMYGGRVDMLGSLDGYEPERFLRFSYSSATRELASSGVILETIGDRILVGAYEEPELRPYVPKEATPAPPELRGYNVYPEFTVISFNIPPVDELGDYLDPKGITWRLILDDEPYVFDPETYHYISERKEEFAWGERDGERGIDIVFEGCGLYTLWIYDHFDSFAVEATFTHDGKSNSVMSDTMEIERNGVEILDADENASETVNYTLDGMRAAGTAPGIVLKAVRTSGGALKVKKSLVTK